MLRPVDSDRHADTRQQPGRLRPKHRKAGAGVRLASVSVTPESWDGRSAHADSSTALASGTRARLCNQHLPPLQGPPMPVGRFTLVADFVLDTTASGICNAHAVADFSPDTTLPADWVRMRDPFQGVSKRAFGFSFSMSAAAPSSVPLARASREIRTGQRKPPPATVIKAPAASDRIGPIGRGGWPAAEILRTQVAWNSGFRTWDFGLSTSRLGLLRGVIVFQIADQDFQVARGDLSGPNAGICPARLQEAVFVRRPRLADHAGDPWGEPQPKSLGASRSAPFGEARRWRGTVPHSFWNGASPGWSATPGLLSQSSGVMSSGIAANEATKSATSSSCLRVELRVLLPFGHAVELRRPCRSRRRASGFRAGRGSSSGSRSRPRSEAVCGARPLAVEDVAAQAASFEHAPALRERVAAEDVGRAVRRDADVGHPAR